MSGLETRSYLSFTLDNERYATSVSKVLNILEMIPFTKVPRAQSYMKGVLNLRGDVIPLIDARLKLGVKAMDYNQNTSILILELEQNKEQIRVGIIVDAVQEVFEMRDDKILAPPSIGNSYAYSYISGVVELNGVFAMILEMDKLFWYNQGESDLENKFSA